MANGCLSTDDLLQLTEYDRVGDLRRALDAQRIRYFVGKGGRPWTTVDLINQAGGLVAAPVSGNDPLYSPDDV